MTTRRAQGYLLNANVVREKAYGEFRGQRLEANPPKVEFHASCKTFSGVERKIKKKRVIEIILKAERGFFGEMVIIAKNRQLHMRDALCRPLGSLLWAPSTANS